MTEWEKERMSTAPQDCLRTFRLNPEAPGGWSEYGETMLDFESTETLTEDNGKAKIALLKADAVAPLPCGIFLRMYLFGQISDGVPVWQTDENGEPKNYRNYYVTSAKSRWFERHPTGHVDRYKHEYDAQEIIACLKDYPIRSTKTFAEGAYTFGECLDVAFTLAFRPRSVGNYAYSIKEFPGLNEPNSKLEYTNATLYDVVSDIGRIIDAVPSMEIVFADGVYTFELRFTDRYGLEGEVHDISYFNNKINDAVNVSRDTNAGACISNVENLVAGNNETEAVYPNSTNTTNGGDWSFYQLPYPIDEIQEVRIYWEWEILENDNTPQYTYVLYNGERRYAGRPVSVGDMLYQSPVIITYAGTSGAATLYDTASSVSQPSAEHIKKLFLRENEEYIYLPDIDGKLSAGKKNSLHYTRGDNKLYLESLFENTYIFWYREIISEIRINFAYAAFSDNPGTPSVSGNNPFAVSVTYKPQLNGVIKGANSKPSDLTVFFNQQGQVVDIQSFGTAVNNYTKTMNGESRVVAHYYNRIGREAMYAEMPKIGSSVVDKERDKRYVITLLSFTRKMHGGQYLAYMTESRGGKSRYIMADNRRTIYAIPSNNVVDSKSHTHILCKMGVRSPFAGTSSAAISKAYLFNGFTGNQHGAETIPDTISMEVLTNDGVKNITTKTINSRIRLSALMCFRMMTNNIYTVQDGNPIMYTDTNGQLESIHFQYKAGDTVAADFSQTLKKDAYEILNHTTQVSWVEYGNLRIGEPLIDMSYFGNGDGLSDALELVLLSSRMRLNDDITRLTAGRYSVTAADEGTAFTFTASSLTALPAHVGWAIVRGSKILLLDNFDILTDNIVKVYYSVEVRD